MSLPMAANNSNTAATSQTVTVSVDTESPGVSISVPSGVQSGAFDATITFTESVSDFVQADLSITGTATASITGWETTDDITYTTEITPTTSGDMTLNIAQGVASDAAGNPNLVATPQTVNVLIAAQVDTDRPIIILYVPTSTQRDEFKASIVFSEPVIGFEQSDVSLDGTAAASITAWAAKSDNSVYTATITPTSSGTVTLGVDAGVATDAANNPNTAATAQTVNVDVDRPTVTIGVSPASSFRQPGAFIVTITFTETVSGFTKSDVSLTGSAASTWFWSTSSDHTVYSMTIVLTASGTVTISVAADVATDAAGNPNTAATSTINATAPVPPLSDRTPQIRDAIVDALWWVAGVSSADDVTAAHLAAIPRLEINRKDITALKVGDFDGLTTLTLISLSDNDLSSLPAGIFDGLTTLKTALSGQQRIDYIAVRHF